MSKWLLIAIAVGVLLYLARGVLAPFVVAAVLAYIFNPVIDEIESRTRLPRLAVVAPLYVLALGLLGAGLWLLEARLVHELRSLSEVGPDLVDSAFVRFLGSETFQFMGQPVDPHDLAARTNQSLDDLLGNPSDVFRVAERAFETILKTILSLIAVFYFLMDGHRVGPYLVRFVPPEQRPHIREVAGRIHLLLGRYLRGQLYLVGLMAIVTYLVLIFIFHLPYALPLAIATGVLEIIPLIGPVVAGTIASIVALGHGGPGLMLGVIVAYFVLRQTEDQLVMPIVVGRAVHLHPLVTIFAVLVGASASGILGAIMAVPVAAAIKVTVDYVFVEANGEADAEPAPHHVPGGNVRDGVERARADTRE